MQKVELVQQETMMIHEYNDAYMIARSAEALNSVNDWSGSPMLRIQLLGTFTLVSDAAQIANLDMPRLQSLLAYLLLNHNVPQSRTRLASLLWPDSTEERAHTNLRNLLYKLRHALPQSDRWLKVDRYTLMWQNNGSWKLDVLEFERAAIRVEQAQQEDDRARMCLALEQPLELYHGDLLPGCYEEWILSERDRLSQLFLNLLERLLFLREQDGDYAGAIRIARLLLSEDPLQEASYGHLMRLYAESGNRSAAIRAYQNCVAVLRRELAVDPGTATRQAYEQIIHSNDIRPYMVMKRSGSAMEAFYAAHSEQYCLCEC
jgi:DNA-binding SARP family transcriptional activator